MMPAEEAHVARLLRSDGRELLELLRALREDVQLLREVSELTRLGRGRTVSAGRGRSVRHGPRDSEGAVGVRTALCSSVYSEGLEWLRTTVKSALASWFVHRSQDGTACVDYNMAYPSKKRTRSGKAACQITRRGRTSAS